ncbi:hypothetical protein ACORG1_11055 [Mycobacterium sp. TJFP1]
MNKIDAVIRSVAVDNVGPLGETWAIGADNGNVHLLVMFDDPDYNQDRELTPEVAEKIGRELIAAAQKAKPRKRYRLVGSS